jgi:hypothetical protein
MLVRRDEEGLGDEREYRKNEDEVMRTLKY